jgi:hypothetical protein
MMMRNMMDGGVSWMMTGMGLVSLLVILVL